MSTFSDIRRQIRQLTFAEQLRLLEELVITVRQRAEAQPKRSILGCVLKLQPHHDGS